MRISKSKIAAYKQCPYRFYVGEVGIAPLVREEKFRRGTYGHKYIEALLLGEPPPEPSPDLYIDPALKMGLDWVKSFVDEIKGRNFQVEKKVEYDMGRYTIVMIYDVLIEDETVEIIDWKFNSYQTDPAEDEGLRFYCAWNYNINGEIPFITLINPLKMSYDSMQPTERTIRKWLKGYKELIDKVLKDMDRVNAGEDPEQIFPTRGGWHCGTCSYAYDCPTSPLTEETAFQLYWQAKAQMEQAKEFLINMAKEGADVKGVIIDSKQSYRTARGKKQQVLEVAKKHPGALEYKLNKLPPEVLDTLEAQGLIKRYVHTTYTIAKSLTEG